MQKLITALLPLALLAGCEPSTPAGDARPSASASASTAPTPSARPTAKTSSSVSEKQPDKPTPVKPGGPAGPAVVANNAFAIDLHHELAKSPGNLAYSPASISLALTMTFGGAKGDTAAEMTKVLHLPDGVHAADRVHEAWATAIAGWQNNGDGWEMAIANRLFGEKSSTFEAPFVALTKDRYGAPLEPRDFKGAPAAQLTYINDWVKSQTRQRIVDLVPEPAITKDTRLVLVNALYLKAEWSETFDEHDTRDAEFFAAGTKSVTVPMMSGTEAYRYAAADGVKLVELAYKGEKLAMLIVLPEARDGLDAVEKDLSLAKLDAWSAKLEFERVWLTWPRFKIDPPKSIDLAQTLEAMGMARAFDRDKADFTGIANPPSPDDRLYIGHVFHKAFVAVDESGTEAAAATAVVMPRAGGKPAEPTRFLVDHPFLFFIRDVENGAILFVGRVVDPSAH